MIPLDLPRIARDLEALEETIILKLIDRAQFCANAMAYTPGSSGFDGESELSLFDVRLKYHEQMDALFGRFEVPEERPFTSGLPGSRRAVTYDTETLNIPDYNRVNLTGEIREAYLRLVPQLCRPGDDGQYGSSVEMDVNAMQAISRRIHYGAFYVAESKYRSDATRFQKLIEAGRREELTSALTRQEVEHTIINRVPEKVVRIQGEADHRIRHLIQPELVGEFYRDTVIPLTKRGEVEYLLAREIG